MGSIEILMVATTSHVVRKKPGRVKYSSYPISSNSTETATEAEKRNPRILHHRDR